jgi:hypothetical protein
MIESILHFLGICPDSVSHISLFKLPLVEINYWLSETFRKIRDIYN